MAEKDRYSKEAIYKKWVNKVYSGRISDGDLFNLGKHIVKGISGNGDLEEVVDEACINTTDTFNSQTIAELRIKYIPGHLTEDNSLGLLFVRSSVGIRHPELVEEAGQLTEQLTICDQGPQPRGKRRFSYYYAANYISGLSGESFQSISPKVTDIIFEPKERVALASFWLKCFKKATTSKTLGRDKSHLYLVK